MQDPGFCTLVRRYFFFGWLFKEVGSGDLFERAAAVRYNREQARWLPTYMLRWLWWGLVFCTFGAAAELVLEAPLLATCFYTLSGISVPFTVAIAAAWIGLRVMHGPV